jgi:hypothetical protein
MLKRGFHQSNADHTLFYKHGDNKVAILIVYVDDIVITCDNHKEIDDLKCYLAQEFEVKDLGHLRYFLGIEVSHVKRYISITNEVHSRPS